MEVFVNGRKIKLHRGMSVKHALIAFDQDLYRAAMDGVVRVEDANGFVIGLEGALSEGAKIFTKPKSERR